MASPDDHLPALHTKCWDFRYHPVQYLPPSLFCHARDQTQGHAQPGRYSATDLTPACTHVNKSLPCFPAITTRTADHVPGSSGP